MSTKDSISRNMARAATTSRKHFQEQCWKMVGAISQRDESWRTDIPIKGDANLYIKVRVTFIGGGWVGGPPASIIVLLQARACCRFRRGRTAFPRDAAAA